MINVFLELLKITRNCQNKWFPLCLKNMVFSSIVSPILEYITFDVFVLRFLRDFRRDSLLPKSQSLNINVFSIIQEFDF